MSADDSGTPSARNATSKPPGERCYSRSCCVRWSRVLRTPCRRCCAFPSSTNSSPTSFRSSDQSLAPRPREVTDLRASGDALGRRRRDACGRGCSLLGRARVSHLAVAIFALQTGSAEVVDAFCAMGVPRSSIGFVISLPGVNIEIAQECTRGPSMPISSKSI